MEVLKIDMFITTYTQKEKIKYIEFKFNFNGLHVATTKLNCT